jgi:hypothetical protein
MNVEVKDGSSTAPAHLGQPPPAGVTHARRAIAYRAVADEIDIDVLVGLRLPTGKQAKTRLQYSTIALTKRNTDEWILSGDLA